MQLKHNISLLNYNTFGMNAVADTFITYDSTDELVSIITRSPEIIIEPVLHIGEGSNLLFRSDFPGTILMSHIHGIEVLKQTEDTVFVKVGAGLKMDGFIDYALENGWYGLENLSNIPGQVGASAVQNIGAYGVEAGDFIHEVHCVSLKNGNLRVFSHDECLFSYRHSILKTKEFFGCYAVTHVVYKLSLVFNPHLDYGGVRQYLIKNGLEMSELTAHRLREAIISIRCTKLPDPKDLGNAGSFFMNPIIDEQLYNELRTRYKEMPSYLLEDGRRKIPAAWLIEQCGWKGRSLGNAGVHEKQPLVLVNLGNATATEILNLSERIVCDIKEKFGIDIHPEVLFV